MGESVVTILGESPNFPWHIVLNTLSIGLFVVGLIVALASKKESAKVKLINTIRVIFLPLGSLYVLGQWLYLHHKRQKQCDACLAE